MNKLIEQIDKLINKKGSLKTPAYYIRGLLIDIVNYFEKKVDSLKNTINKNVKEINEINKKLNSNSSTNNIIYAGYSNGSLNIKDINKNYFTVGSSIDYSSTVVIYSTKEIIKAKIEYINQMDNGRLASKIVNMEKKHNNNIFIYYFNLFNYVNYDDISAYSLPNFYIAYKEPKYTDDYIKVYLHEKLKSSTGLEVIAARYFKLSDTITFRIFAFEYDEFILDINSDITKVTPLGANHFNADIKALLNNKIINGDYVKETDNDKLIFKIVKYGT